MDEYLRKQQLQADALIAETTQAIQEDK